MQTEVQPDELKRLAEIMMRADKASQQLGIQLVDIKPGEATTTMMVREDMMNGFGICHGGITFTLADTAFACACNSRNRKTVALSCTINFIAACNVGDFLTAVAKEVALKGRTGVYDISIHNQKGELVAEFRGTSYGTSSPVIEL